MASASFAFLLRCESADEGWWERRPQQRPEQRQVDNPLATAAPPLLAFNRATPTRSFSFASSTLAPSFVSEHTTSAGPWGPQHWSAVLAPPSPRAVTIRFAAVVTEHVRDRVRQGSCRWRRFHRGTTTPAHWSAPCRHTPATIACTGLALGPDGSGRRTLCGSPFCLTGQVETPGR